jgi:hypothetical protein
MISKYFTGINGKVLLATAATCYLINIFGPIMRHSWDIGTMGKNVQDVAVQQRFGFGDLDFSDFSQEERALDVVRYADIVAAAVLREYRSTPSKYSLIEQMESRSGDCKIYTSLTYAKFLALTDMMDEPELRENVRMVGGVADTSQGYLGHVWLEIKVDDEWHDYETTVLKGGEVRGDREISSDLLELTWSGMVDVGDPIKYVSFQVLPDGSVVSDREMLNAFSYWPGGIGLFINSINYKGGKKKPSNLAGLDDRLILPEAFFEYFEEQG